METSCDEFKVLRLEMGFCCGGERKSTGLRRGVRSSRFVS